jgi:hypothetical protein
MIGVSRGKISPSSGFVAVFCRGTGFALASGGEIKDIQPARVTRLGVVRRRRLGWGRSECSRRRKPRGGAGEPTSYARRRRGHDSFKPQRQGSTHWRRYSGNSPSKKDGRMFWQGSQGIHAQHGRRAKHSFGARRRQCRTAAQRSLRPHPGLRLSARRHDAERGARSPGIRSRLYSISVSLPCRISSIGARSSRSRRGPLVELPCKLDNPSGGQKKKRAAVA